MCELQVLCFCYILESQSLNMFKFSSKFKKKLLLFVFIVKSVYEAFKESYNLK